MALWEAAELKGKQSWPSEDHQDLGSTLDHRTRPMKPKGSDHPEREQQTQQVQAEPSTSPHSFSGAAGAKRVPAWHGGQPAISVHMRAGSKRRACSHDDHTEGEGSRRGPGVKTVRLSTRAAPQADQVCVRPPAGHWAHSLESWEGR